MTEKEEAETAKYMRIAEFFRTHEYILEENAEMRKQALRLKELLDNLFSLLTEEEKDQALERYKKDMAYLSTLKDE
jgi:hypothetical protein